jgi:hypothetical protein
MAPLLPSVPMNKVLLTYEYAGSATFNVVGAALDVDDFICINVFAIKTNHH